MSCSAGPNTVEDGLVFSYDMANTKKSWKGMPTVNLAPDVDYSSRAYNTIYDIGGWGGDDADVVYYPNGGWNDLPYKKMVKSVGGTGGSFIDEHRYFAIELGRTYTISAYMKANKSISVAGYALCINRENDNKYRVPPAISLTPEWVRHSWQYTPAVGEEGVDYHGRHIIYNDEPYLPLEVYWCGFQVEESSFATPFVDGTRSNTEAITDLTGNNVITANSLTYNADGSFSFDGVDTNISLGNPVDLQLGSNLSVEAIVKPEEEKWMYFFHKGYATNNSLFLGRHSNGSWFFGSYYNAVYNYLYFGTATVGEWFHLVFTYDGINMRAYENGVLKITDPWTTDVMTSGSNISIGGGERNWNGKISKIKIYNKALTANEIKQNFNATRGRFGIL